MGRQANTDSNSVRHPVFFKRCTKCHHIWSSRDLFLQDPELKIIGYQANFEELEMGAFLFNHSCKTTMSVWAKDFFDLYHGVIAKNRADGSEECPGYCLDRDELRPCSVNCEYAYVRQIVSIIRSWPKRSATLG